jgi:phosphoglycolate phosphatase
MALIVFDLDGTLIDSRKDLAHSANALIRERGGTELPEETIGRMVGDGAAALVRRALTAAGLPVDETGLHRFLELYDARLLRTTRPYSGIEEALKAIQQFGPLAVLTNKPLEPTRKLLNALCLEPFFVTVMGGEGAFPRKPDPHGLQHLMAMHGTEAQNTILVGDSQIDAATARAAGVRFCWARYGFGAVDALTAAAVVDAPKDLPAAILALLR